MHPSFASDEEGRPIQRHYLHVQVKYTFRQKDHLGYTKALEVKVPMMLPWHYTHLFFEVLK